MYTSTNRFTNSGIASIGMRMHAFSITRCFILSRFLIYSQIPLLANNKRLEYVRLSSVKNTIKKRTKFGLPLLSYRFHRKRQGSTAKTDSKLYLHLKPLASRTPIFKKWFSLHLRQYLSAFRCPFMVAIAY